MTSLMLNLKRNNQSVQKKAGRFRPMRESIFLVSICAAFLQIVPVNAAESYKSDSQKYREGIRNFDTLIAKEVDLAKKSRAMFGKSAFQFAGQDYVGARQTLQKLSKPPFGKDVQILATAHIADCAFQLGDYETAAKLFKTAQDALGSESIYRDRLQLMRASSLGRCKRWDEAIECYKDALVKTPADNLLARAWCLSDIADCYDKTGRHELEDVTREESNHLFEESLRNLESALKLARPTGIKSMELVWYHLAPAHPLLPIKVWRPTVTPSAAILCIHGMGLSTSAFEELGRALSARGILVVALDVRGFGSWQGDPIGGLDFDRAIKDIQNVSQIIRRKNPEIPLVLLGESMGGNIALRCAAKFPGKWDAIVSSVPGHRRYNEVNRALQFALAVLTNPGADVDLEEDILESVTSKEDVRQRWRNDPGAKLQLNKQDGPKFAAFMKEAPKFMSQVTDPLFMTQGSQDQLVKPSSTIGLFNGAKTTEKNLVLLGTNEHFVFELGQTPPVLLDGLCTWLKFYGAKRKP